MASQWRDRRRSGDGGCRDCYGSDQDDGAAHECPSRAKLESDFKIEDLPNWNQITIIDCNDLKSHAYLCVHSCASEELSDAEKQKAIATVEIPAYYDLAYTDLLFLERVLRKLKGLPIFILDDSTEEIVSIEKYIVRH